MYFPDCELVVYTFVLSRMYSVLFASFLYWILVAVVLVNIRMYINESFFPSDHFEKYFVEIHEACSDAFRYSKQFLCCMFGCDECASHCFVAPDKETSVLATVFNYRDC